MFFSPLEQFQIIALIPMSLGQNFDFSFTNSSLLMLFITGFATLFLSFSSYQATIAPSRWQVVAEEVYGAVLTLVNENIQSPRRHEFFPLIFVLFTFLLFANLLGMIPYSFTITSHLIVTFGLGFALFFGLNVIGVMHHGFHFWSLFLPPGVPVVMALLLVPVELISYVFRVISISVRLFANMMAGHALLKILAGFAFTMFSAGGIMYILHLAPLVVIFAIIGLELGIATLQAFIFTVLTCMYINDALNLH
jgi:ATP synthase subunit 6